ncbi:MAG: thioredoxin domain-containing protein [Myxococcales bacterium]|nr:thioredoxin domain-containing protein [Myxococcales bacterium]
MTLISLRTVFVAAVVSTMAFSTACTKKDGSKEDDSAEAYKDIEKTFDKSEPPAADRKPIEGVDVSKLEKHMQPVFEALVDKLPSPCGKAHSLRTSRNTDADCNRAPFATEYVFELTLDGASESEIKELYKLRFDKTKVVDLKVSAQTPHHGPSDAPVKVIEFFDYGCPACKMMEPMFEESLKGYETEVAVYYKQFPLSAHPDSQGAAQAALAAHKQGKFDEMHNMLFADQHAHELDSLNSYAGKLGVDMAQFKSDYAAMKAVVDADKAEGEAVGISGTPAVYINGRSYDGPNHPKYFKMWIAEALAEAI